jgi:hypothetical protein
MVIWSKTLPDGSTARVEDVLLPLKGYRDGRQYMVIVSAPGDSGKKGICKVDEGGSPIVWYEQPDRRAAWLEVMKDLPDALAVEQVMEI